MKLNWNFLGGEGVRNEKPSVGGGGMDIFWSYMYILFGWFIMGSLSCSGKFS